MNEPIRVLISGGFGFLGGRIAKYLANKGYKIILGSRINRPPPEWLPEAKVAQLNWSDENALAEVCQCADIVIHAAGMNAQECESDPVSALDFNGLVTARFAKASKRSGVAKFIYLSTAHVYKCPLSGNIDEGTCPRNLHPYATSHLAGENAALSMANESTSFTAIVLRLSNVVGRPMSVNANCWTLLVNDLCKEVVVENRITIRGDPNSVRDFISLTSLTKICECLINKTMIGAFIHNIGSGSSHTVMQLAMLIRERFMIHFGKEPKIASSKILSSDPLSLAYKSKSFACALEYDEKQNIIKEIDDLLVFCASKFGGGSL